MHLNMVYSLFSKIIIIIQQMNFNIFIQSNKKISVNNSRICTINDKISGS